MHSRNILTALALVSTVVASTASAQSAYESLPLPYGDQLGAPDRTQMQAQPDGTAGIAIGTPKGAEGPVLEGTVAAVDYESGQLIVDTDEGLVRFTADPGDLEDVRVGDVIRVALLDDERD